MHIEKLKKTFKINPLKEADGYKIAHPMMLADNTKREYWTWIPRSLKYMPGGINKLMSAGQQIVVRYLHSTFQENFFDQPIEVAHKFTRDMSKYIGGKYDFKGFEDLHKLGFLPIMIQALPEGIFTKPNIPHMAGINTLDGYAWLGLFLETYVSKLAWQTPTTATIAAKFKQNSIEWINKTDPENMWFADFANHDFHSRGGNPFTSIVAGLGHAMSNKGSDTLNVIDAARYFYDFDEEEVPINSVNASEHSVTCTGLFYYQDVLKDNLPTIIGELKTTGKELIEEYYSYDLPCEGSVEDPDYLAIAEWVNLRTWLVKFPTGILSVVADTMNLWKLINHVVARLKKEILARDGKVVLRPDSGDPVDITCGEQIISRDYRDFVEQENLDRSHPKYKGVVELLWDIFGGEKTSTGYNRLDSHIGAIYGDSINLERQVQIYERLAKKGFSATNIVLGVGSYTYVMLTRDSAGFAAKGAWFEIENELGRKQYNIYKDPITDNGTKKSLRGFQFVSEGEDGEYNCESEVSEEKAFSESNLLRVIYKDGKFYNQTTLTEVRERVASFTK